MSSPWYAVFSALRAYVLSSKGWPLAALVFLLSLGPVGVNYVREPAPIPKVLENHRCFSQATMAYATTMVDPVFGCEVGLSLPDTVTREICA